MMIYVIHADSGAFSWEAYGTTPDEARAAFIAMWRDWCAKSGASLDYWGPNFEDVEPQPRKLGSTYRDYSEYTI